MTMHFRRFFYMARPLAPMDSSKKKIPASSHDKATHLQSREALQATDRRLLVSFVGLLTRPLRKKKEKKKEKRKKKFTNN